jgi:predicted esterase
MRFILGLILALLGAANGRAQADMIGRILDPVTCQQDPKQTYVLYVPSNYTPQKLWPVIFCFDPGARGREPVERLQAAAEKYGYIVAGSLTSRNGLWAANAAAIQAMAGDVDAHLRLDPRRIYAAGLSGGARVATQLALIGFAKGVIACSAGFPQSDQGIPQKLPFVFYGTAGTEDFNYRELRKLDDELDDRGATHRIVVIEGGHEWAPAPQLTEAVLWLELQAMRSGARPRDDAMIQAAFAARVAALPTQPAGEVWRASKEIAADFTGLADVKPFDQRARELGATGEVKAWRKAERDLITHEEWLSGELADLTSEGATAAVKKKVAELRALADAPADSPERRMAKRVLTGTAMFARENVRGLMDQGDYADAARLLETAIAIRPEQTRNYFDLARARALDGDRKRALEVLQQAAGKGFSDAARIEDDGAFAKLKTDPAWPALLARVRANPSEPVPPSRGGP